MYNGRMGKEGASKINWSEVLPTYTSRFTLEEKSQVLSSYLTVFGNFSEEDLAIFCRVALNGTENDDEQLKYYDIEQKLGYFFAVGDETLSRKEERRRIKLFVQANETLLKAQIESGEYQQLVPLLTFEHDVLYLMQNIIGMEFPPFLAIRNAYIPQIVDGVSIDLNTGQTTDIGISVDSGESPVDQLKRLIKRMSGEEKEL